MPPAALDGRVQRIEVIGAFQYFRVGKAPIARENMIFTSIRYYPF